MHHLSSIDLSSEQRRADHGHRIHNCSCSGRGTAIGGLTSFVTSWITLSAQMRAQRLESSKSKRQKLYKTFIIDAARAYGDALIHDKLDIVEVSNLYAYISRTRVLLSSKSRR